MRWIPFLFLGGVALILQSTIAPRLELLGARPDWLLVLVLFYALHARMPGMAFGAWVLGGCADLMTIEQPGLMAFSYTAAVLVAYSVRDLLFRDRAGTQLAVTFVMSFVIQLGWMCYRRIGVEQPQSIAEDLVVSCFVGSLYTALWAPPIHKVLSSMSRSLGIARPRYTYAGLYRLDNGHV